MAISQQRQGFANAIDAANRWLSQWMRAYDKSGLFATNAREFREFTGQMRNVMARMEGAMTATHGLGSCSCRRRRGR